MNVIFKELAGKGGFCLDDFFRRAFGDDVSAFVATFGAEVDDPVGTFDDVHVMFDDHNGVACINEAVENVNEFFDVCEVEACGGFVKNVERFAC